MSISGINNYNYPNYYAGARHNMAKTGGRDSGVLSSTSSASSNITLTSTFWETQQNLQFRQRNRLYII